MLRVLRYGLVKRFSNHLYLFLFCIITILIVLGENNFYSTKTRLDLSLTSLNWKIYLPAGDFTPSIRTLFRKIIHFNCPLKLCNNFIPFPISISFAELCLMYQHSYLKWFFSRIIYPVILKL